MRWRIFPAGWSVERHLLLQQTDEPHIQRSFQLGACLQCWQWKGQHCLFAWDYAKQFILEICSYLCINHLLTFGAEAWVIASCVCIFLVWFLILTVLFITSMVWILITDFDPPCTLRLVLIWCQLCCQVAEHGEMAHRIEDDVMDTETNVMLAQTQLLKYLNTISSNRWLIMKIFIVLMIFVIIFVFVL